MRASQCESYNHLHDKSSNSTAVLGCLLVVAGIAIAQRLSRQAWDRIAAAQAANEWDMEGHAQKAKGLLDQVNVELKLAAEAANRNK